MNLQPHPYIFNSGEDTMFHNIAGIPLRGLGTFQPDPKAYPENSVKDSVLYALQVGYRHIDTAFAYSNGEVEKGVGEAVRESGIDRRALFIVSKL